MTTVVLTAAGTWAPWDAGYPADVGRALSSEWDDVLAEIKGEAGPAFRWQPIGYPAVGFLNPDPNTSYNESVAAGVGEGMRLIDGIAGDVDLVGYSQGAEVVIRIAMAMALQGRQPRRIVTFGSPCRAPGPTKVGNSPTGSGISRIYTPPELRSRTWDVVRNGDMYATATDDTLIPLFYPILTDAEMSAPFAMTVFQLLTPVFLELGGFLIPGLGALGGLATMFTGLLAGVAGAPQPSAEVRKALSVSGILSDPAKVVATMMVLLQFLTHNTHMEYHLPAPEFGGRTGIQVAVAALLA